MAYIEIDYVPYAIGSQSKTMLLKISKIFLYAATFSVLVVLPSTFFPFIGGKYYFFRVAVEGALLCLFLWWGFEAAPAAAKQLGNRAKALARTPLVVAVSLFVLSFLLAAIFAQDPSGAFWSNFERGEGGFQMLHYYAFFLLLALLFENEKDWKMLFCVSLAAAIGMIAYGIAANTKTPGFIGPAWGDPSDTLWERLVGPRFQGSLGNPAYVAPYLLFILFYAAYLAVTSSRWGAPRVRWTVFGVTAAFFLFFFATSQTRGAFFGLAAGIFAFLIYVGILDARRRAASLAWIAVALLLGGWLVHMRDYTVTLPGGAQPSAEHVVVLPESLSFLFPSSDASVPTAGFLNIIPGGRFFDLPLKDMALWVLGFGSLLVAGCIEFLGHPRYRRWALGGLALIVMGGGLFGYKAFLGEFLGQSDGTVQTVKTRLWTWGSAWQAFKERPLLGWGPENFSAAFDKYFDTRHYVSGTNAETWFDRAHSVVFDYLAEIGLLGFLAYASMFGVFAWHLGRLTLVDLRPGVQRAEKKEAARAQGREKQETRFSENIVVRGLLMGVVVAYLVQGLAIFDVLPMYINLFILLAFSCHYFYSSASPRHGSKPFASSDDFSAEHA